MYEVIETEISEEGRDDTNIAMDNINDESEKVVNNKPNKVGRVRRRLTRRGGRGGKTVRKDKADVKIIQTNCDGFTSKKESFVEIINDKHPDVLFSK